jgi:hypothetical protein
VDIKPHVKKQKVTRRNMLKAGAAGVLGTAATAALTATPASAADGDPIILGQENNAFSTTQVSFRDSGDIFEIFPLEGGRVLRADTGFGRWAIVANAEWHRDPVSRFAHWHRSWR